MFAHLHDLSQTTNRIFMKYGTSQTTNRIFMKYGTHLQQKLLGELTFGTHGSNITPTLHDTQNRFHTLSTNAPPPKKKSEPDIK
jgi:hypothetical protein